MRAAAPKPAGSILTRPPVAHRLKCAETWGGNEKIARLVELPGLRAWIHSVPSGSSEADGDVHHVSVCPSCIVSRVALADVSGHGHGAASVSATLRELMQHHLGALEQTELMRDLNHAVRQGIADTHHATMVAVGFHGRRGLLVVTNAGHPPPLWYRAKRDEWSWVEPPHRAQHPIAAGTPLGLLPDISYDRKIIKPLDGDLVVLYSDGMSEATNQDNEELGGDGLMALARRLGPRSAQAFGTALADAVHEFRGGTEATDDQTVIVMERMSAVD